MNVQQLINTLNGLDPNMMVVVDGYEGGLTEVNRVYLQPIKLNVHTESYYGPHELYRLSDTSPQDAVAVHLPR